MPDRPVIKIDSIPPSKQLEAEIESFSFAGKTARENFFRVSEKPPYEITFPKIPGKKSSRSEIAVIDTIYSTESLSDDRSVKIVGSHFAYVMHSFDAKANVTKAFDASDGKGNIDLKKVNNILDYLLSQQSQLNIRVINMSFAGNVTIDSINDYVKYYSGKKNPPSITKDNINEYSDIIKKSLENIPKSHSDYAQIREELQSSNKINKWIENGGAVIKSAGNNGSSKIDLTTALTPDIIVAGGLDKHAMPEASSNIGPLVDYWGTYAIGKEVKMPSGGKLKLPDLFSGTSMSAPQLCDDTAIMIDHKIPIKKINEIFRIKSHQAIKGLPDEIIIFDAMKSTEHDIDREWTKTQEQRVIVSTVYKTFKERVMATTINTYEIFAANPTLTIESYNRLLMLLNGQITAVSISKSELNNLASELAKFPEGNQTAEVSKIMQSQKKFNSVDEILKVIKSARGSN